MEAHRRQASGRENSGRDADCSDGEQGPKDAELPNVTAVPKALRTTQASWTLQASKDREPQIRLASPWERAEGE